MSGPQLTKETEYILLNEAYEYNKAVIKEALAGHVRNERDAELLQRISARQNQLIITLIGTPIPFGLQVKKGE